MLHFASAGDWAECGECLGANSEVEYGSNTLLHSCSALWDLVIQCCWILSRSAVELEKTYAKFYNHNRRQVLSHLRPNAKHAVIQTTRPL